MIGNIGVVEGYAWDTGKTVSFASNSFAPVFAIAFQLAILLIPMFLISQLIHRSLSQLALAIAIVIFCTMIIVLIWGIVEGANSNKANSLGNVANDYRWKCYYGNSALNTNPIVKCVGIDTTSAVSLGNNGAYVTFMICVAILAFLSFILGANCVLSLLDEQARNMIEQVFGEATSSTRGSFIQSENDGYISYNVRPSQTKKPQSTSSHSHTKTQSVSSSSNPYHPISNRMPNTENYVV